MTDDEWIAVLVEKFDTISRAIDKQASPTEWMVLNITADDKALLTDDEWALAEKGEISAVDLILERGGGRSATTRAVCAAYKRKKQGA